MQDQDQEDPTDRSHPFKPSRPEQPKDDPVNPDESSCEQDVSQNPTHKQRFKEYPAFKRRAFKTVLAVGIAVIGGAVVWASRSDEEIEQAGTSVLKGARETSDAGFEGAGEGASRKSPSEHLVGGHERSQHYGPNGAETRTIKVSPYSRGGSA